MISLNLNLLLKYSIINLISDSDNYHCTLKSASANNSGQALWIDRYFEKENQSQAANKLLSMSATMPNVKAVSDNNSGKFIQVLIFNLLFSVQGRTQFVSIQMSH